MNCEIKQLWDGVFGTAWDTFLNSSSDIGAFLLCQKSRAVMFDKNAQRLLNYNHVPSYEEAYMALTSLVELNDTQTSVKVIVAEDSERCKAGYLRLKNEPNYGFSTELPLCSQSRLIMLMTQNNMPSLLALLQFEEYGNPNMSMDTISEVVLALKEALPEEALLSAMTQNKFWLYVPNMDSDKIKYLEDLQKVVKDCTQKSIHQAMQRRSITFTAGCGDEHRQPSQRMHTAEYTLFDAISKGIGSICIYSKENYEQQKNEYDSMRKVTKLIDNNLFTYHFQPIVSARNGEIIAYEALMRTEKDIDMYPLEILNMASKLDRTYDIEKATLKNTLRYISENQDLFKNKKLFINSIPAYMLSEEDWEALVRDYGELMEKLVLEMTEQTELDDGKLAIIRDRLERNQILLAIDDYGTGYSNTTNLLRYNPNYVKIDRALIAGINNKPKIEKLVSGIIEYVHANGFFALAEGVETADELKTMIRLGVDLIQGYYLSKPKPFILNEITSALCEEILEYNRIYVSEIKKVYHPGEGEIVDICRLEKEKYASIFIENDNVVLAGNKDIRVNITVQIKDGLTTKLVLKDCCITSEIGELSNIELGNETRVELWVEGNNECVKGGIHVPQTSALHVLGNGSLRVLSEGLDCYGIGEDREHSPGNIILESTGKIDIEANGDNSVAIGGGRNSHNSFIKLLGGDIKIYCSGIDSVGIGIFAGNSIIDISNCNLDIEMSSFNMIGIGSKQGRVNVHMDYFSVNVVLTGHSMCGIGTIGLGEGEIALNNGCFECNMHAYTANCIGSRDGMINCIVKDVTTKMYCEGSSIAGIGNVNGDGFVDICDSDITIRFRAKDTYALAAKEEKIKISNCVPKIFIND